MPKPTVHRTKVIAQSKIFTIEQMELEFSNGVKTKYERLKGSSRGAVLIVPIKANGQVTLIREYSAGVDRYELALPKGKIDRNETILDAANRELKEEVGFGARKLEHITSYTVAPGYLSHTTHIVLAQDLYYEKLQGDEPEPLETSTWSLDDLDTLMNHPEMSEARTIAALYQTRDILKHA